MDRKEEQIGDIMPERHAKTGHWSKDQTEKDQRKEQETLNREGRKQDKRETKDWRIDLNLVFSYERILNGSS